MRNGTTLIFLLIITSLASCGNKPEQTEKYYNHRNNILSIQDRIVEIQFGDVYLSNFSRLYAMDNYLIIKDYKSFDNLVYIFDKNNFNFLANIIPRGQGPNEIANIGHIGTNEKNRTFYVSDHGKQKIFSYQIDSILANPSYKPVEILQLVELRFPNQYVLINDTLCFGQIIEPIGNYGFNQSIAKWNLHTGEITTMKYTHPEIEKKRISFAVSKENGIYVECYHHHDLITICDLEGNLLYNIYGKQWDNTTSNKKQFFGDVVFWDDKILACYSEGKNNLPNEDLPTQLLVFDITGDYLRTLETGYRIVDLCLDEQNNRLILHLDDEIQFGYITLNDDLYK